MTITYEEAKEIARRLPIGYYLGRKVQVDIDPGGGARADVVKRVIHIGMNILANAASKVTKEMEAKWDRETILRCVLYHEIGHILLTPQWLGYYITHENINHFAGGEYVTTIEDAHAFCNIVEDERIERLLESFFIGVDFHGFIQMLSAPGGDTKEAKVFDAVRLRVPAALSADVDDFVAKTATINTVESGWLTYAKAMGELIKKILEYKDEGDKKPSDSDSKDKDKHSEGGKSDGDPSPDKDKSKSESDGKSDEPEDKPDESGEPDKPDESDDTDDGEPSPSEPGDEGKDDKPEGEDESYESDSKGEEEGDADDKSDGESEPGDGKPESGDAESNGCSPMRPDYEHGEPRKLDVDPSLLTAATNAVFPTPPADVKATLNRLAIRLSKKKGALAAGCWSGLHGRISTKRDAMDKDRIFRRQADIGDRLNTAVHLTLWVDVSGSFQESEGKLNEILSAVNETMKMSGGRLDVDVVKMGVHAKVASETDWAIETGGGNAIDRTYHEAYVATRRKDRRNIDIVVFDGDAKSDDCGGRSRPMPDGRPVELVIWNHPDCHIISDYQNEQHFKGLDKAHVKYVNGDYAEQLQSEVVKTLDRIM